MKTDKKVPLDFNLHKKIKTLAAKMSKPGALVTITDIVNESVKLWLNSRDDMK